MDPLVSIVVVTYNSSEYILETLESVKAQTYKNIELIITDDCSKDNTLGLCRNWLNENGSCFVRARIITTEQNTGIPANCNRGYKEVQGEWIKGIAGDDILLPNCVEDYVSYVESNINVNLIASRMQMFSFVNNKFIDKGIYPGKEEFYSKDSFGQFMQLLEGNLIPAPTIFAKASLMKEYPYDEKCRWMEDYPFWLKITQMGYKIAFMDKITVKYRIANSSVHSSKHLYPKSLRDLSQYFFFNEKKYLLEKYRPELLDKERKSLLLMELSDLMLKNKKTRLNTILHTLLKKIIYSFSFPV